MAVHIVLCIAKKRGDSRSGGISALRRYGGGCGAVTVEHRVLQRWQGESVAAVLC